MTTFRLTDVNASRQAAIKRQNRIQWRVEETKAGRLKPTDGPTRKAYKAKYGEEAPIAEGRYERYWREVATHNRPEYLEHLRRTS